MLDRYRELAAKVDAFFARVAARHPDDLRCAAGCDACCRQRLTVTTIEADAIAALIAALGDEARRRLGEIARREDRCAALDDAGRCAIYAARPLVCRSHGVPIRTRNERGLPVVDACRLNFTARGPAAADPDCVLDQTTLSATLAMIDQVHTGKRDAARHELADVIRAALQR
jgi:hypothetical protein